MASDDRLVGEFQLQRERLRAIALRMLGSVAEADDAVQEAWLRLRRVDPGSVDNLGAWLTTDVSRICLDMLRARSAGPVPSAEGGMETRPGTGSATGSGSGSELDPEEEAVLVDTVGQALLVVLDTLEPAERLAFVLHDLFGVPFDEVAPIVGRTPVATRKLASRARRRIGEDPSVPTVEADVQAEAVAAFLSAARHGEFATLLELLDPEIVLRADAVAVDLAAQRAAAGAPDLAPEMRGVDAVSRVFAGGAKAARLTSVDGLAGAAVSFGGQPTIVFDFTVRDGRVVAIDLIADPETIATLDLEAVR